MPAQVKTKINLKPLEDLKRNFKANLVTQVGIFGNKTGRSEGLETNASIGTQHEFGSLSKKIPERSFLRMPLETQNESIIIGLENSIKSNITKKDGIKKIYAQLGTIAESIIQRAFNTGGFGQWEALKPRTIKEKGKSNILEDTLQLRKSIASRVVER